MSENERAGRANTVGDEPIDNQNVWARRMAWAVVATGSGLLAVLLIAVDIADGRGSGFFEESDPWFFSHMVGGGAFCVTIAAIVVLILTPTRDDESATHRWKRAGWSLVGVVVFIVAARLLRAVLIGAGA